MSTSYDATIWLRVDPQYAPFPQKRNYLVARSRPAMKIARRQDRITVEDGPVAGSTLMPAAGYALLRASSREELARHVRAFLQVAGDGACEIIEAMEPMPQRASAAA